MHPVLLYNLLNIVIWLESIANCRFAKGIKNWLYESILLSQVMMTICHFFVALMDLLLWFWISLAKTVGFVIIPSGVRIEDEICDIKVQEVGFNARFLTNCCQVLWQIAARYWNLVLVMSFYFFLVVFFWNIIHLYVHLKHWCTNYGLFPCLKLKLGKLFIFYFHFLMQAFHVDELPQNKLILFSAQSARALEL